MPRPALPVHRLAGGALLLVATACGRGDAGDGAALDSAMARDLTLAASASSAPRRPAMDPLALGDTALRAPEPVPAPRAEAPARPPTRARPAPTPAPAATTPRPRPAQTAEAPPPVAAPESEPAVRPAAAGLSRGLRAGTALALSTTDRLCSATNRPGDKLVAKLMSPVSGPGGVTLPTGSEVVLEVASVSGDPDGHEAQVTLKPRGVLVDGQFVPLAATPAPARGVVERVATEKKGGSGKGKIIGGAIAGAILGQVIGRDAKGTIIGAAAGAAAGTAANAIGSRGWQACLAPGASVELTLDADAVVP